MKTYIYTNNLTGKVLLEVKTNNILDADKIINETLNIKVEKLGHIGCDFKEN